MKSICRIISKKALEITKCKSTLVKILVIFHLIKAGCIFYKQIRSPVFSLFIYKIRSSSTVIYDIQGFALCIPAIFQDFLLQPGGDTTDILHKTNRIFENLLVHFLENIALLSGFCGKYSTVSLINVAISKYANLFKFTAKIKAVDYFHQFLESDKLPEPIYTPSTKAEIGDHDENISFEQSIDHLEKYFPGRGKELAEKLRDNTIALYKKCAEYALSKGIIIADTKFEFGLDEEGNMVIGDEMLTPDSSRFWPADGYEPGHGQPSFDKQFARDWLTANPDNNWTLPQEIVDKTIEKYLQAYEMLTGEKLA